jgi:iron complex transport system substrate-binding protein
VKNGGVIPMDDDIASRWSPRIVDYIEAVSAAVSKLPAKTG